MLSEDSSLLWVVEESTVNFGKNRQKLSVESVFEWPNIDPGIYRWLILLNRKQASAT